MRKIAEVTVGSVSPRDQAEALRKLEQKINEIVRALNELIPPG